MNWKQNVKNVLKTAESGYNFINKEFVFVKNYSLLCEKTVG